MPLEVQAQNVQSFLDSFLSSDQKAPEQVETPIQSSVQDIIDQSSSKAANPPQETAIGEQGEDNKPKPELGKEEIEKVLNKGEDEKKVEEENIYIKDVSKLSEVLKEKNLLIPYEDGTLPTTQEEIIDALTQSIPFQVQQSVEAAWKERVEALPESILKIHEYAAKGVTTAQQLAQFTNAVAQTEIIGALDPKVADDQEQIVLLQLLNTGLDEKSAREEVADLKAQNKLEDRATRFFPTLKKAYDDNVRRQEIEKIELDNEQQQYIQTNATNVKYFLEKDTEYLPFKLDNRTDKQYKNTIFNLAGQPVERLEDGTPVFGWQKHLESLQYGTEEEYKKFMKIMAFMADDKKYEEAVGKKVKTATEVKEFKKIATSTGTSVNSLPKESSQQSQPGIKKSNTWGIS
jgi:hypothetical protein